MTTFVIPAGRQIYNGATDLNRPTTTVIDAETNDPFFLQDWLAWRDNPQGNFGWRDPCRIDALASGFVWQGGRFPGNIPRNQNRTGPDGFYTSGTPQRFNGAVWFPQISVPGTIRGAEFGILDDLDSGFCDGIRAVQMSGALTVDECIFSCARDDCIEADGQTAALNVTDSFFEHVYSWISATSNGNDIRSKVINVTDSLCRFRAWPEEGGASQIGPVFKVDGSTSTNIPVFNMTRITLHIPNQWPERRYERTRNALGRMNVTDCDLLVSGGPLDNANGLRDAFIAAGWNLIENTSEANSIWAARKAAKLLELGGGGGPVVEPSITSPFTINSLV